MAETAILHLVLHRWSPVLAWCVTLLSIASGLWLIRDWRAARDRPPTADEEGLDLRVGLRWSARVPWSRVMAVSDSHDGPDGVALTLWGPPDLWLHLDRPLEVRGPMGIRLERRVLGVGVDDPARLRELLDQHGPAGREASEA